MRETPQHGPRLATAIAAGLLGLCAGCAHVGYDLAWQYQADGRYADAVVALQSAIADDPQDLDEHRQLLEQCKQRAADREVARAKQCFSIDSPDASNAGKGDLFLAEYHLTRALEYVPNHAAANKYLGQVDVFKSRTQKDVAAAKKRLNAGKPDEALAIVRRIQELAKTYPEIESLTRRTLRASADLHLDRATHAFDDHQYDKALEEAKIALERLPADPVCLAWRDRSQRYAAASQLVRQANQLFGRGRYQQSYETYERALSLADDVPGGMAGSAQALAAWAGRIYDSARLVEAKGRKRDILKALGLYMQCRDLLKGFRDTEARIAHLNQRAARIYFAEAQAFANQPDFQRIALAHEFFRRAKAHDAALPGLAAALDRATQLLQLKYRLAVRVQLKGATPFASELVGAVVAHLRRTALKGQSVEAGSAAGLQAALTRQAQALGYSRFSPDVDSPFQTVQVQGDVLDDVASKTGHSHPLPVMSDYVPRSNPVDNIEYLKRAIYADFAGQATGILARMQPSADQDRKVALRHYLAAKNAHDAASRVLSERSGIQKAHYAAAKKYESAMRRDSAAANQYQDKARTARASAQNAKTRAASYRQQASTTQNQQAADRLRRQAADEEGRAQQSDALAHTYDAKAAKALQNAEANRRQAASERAKGDAMRPEVTSLEQHESRARTKLDSARRWLASADAAVRSIASRASHLKKGETNARSALRRTPSKVGAPVLAAYSFTRKPIQVFGKVHVRMQVVALAGDCVLDQPEVIVSDLAEGAVQEGVRRGDQNGFRNRTDALPSPQTYLKALRRKAKAKLLSKLQSLFARYPERYLGLAEGFRQDGQTLDAMEWYLCYVAAKPRKSPALARAKAFVEANSIRDF